MGSNGRDPRSGPFRYSHRVSARVSLPLSIQFFVADSYVSFAFQKSLSVGDDGRSDRVAVVDRLVHLHRLPSSESFTW